MSDVPTAPVKAAVRVVPAIEHRVLDLLIGRVVTVRGINFRKTDPQPALAGEHDGQVRRIHLR